MNKQLQFFNTNSTTVEMLHQEHKKCATQNAEIKQMFLNNPGLQLTAEDVYKLGGFKKRQIPLTSVRIALSTLQKQLFIYKTSSLCKGQFGKQIHYYTLVIIIKN